MYLDAEREKWYFENRVQLSEESRVCFIQLECSYDDVGIYLVRTKIKFTDGDQVYEDWVSVTWDHLGWARISMPILICPFAPAVFDKYVLPAHLKKAVRQWIKDHLPRIRPFKSNGRSTFQERAADLGFFEKMEALSRSFQESKKIIKD